MNARKFFFILGLVIALLLIMEAFAISYLSEKARIPQSGNVQLPADIIPIPTTISWGTLANGTIYHTAITLNNDGDLPATLNMTYDLVIQIESLVWDFEGQTLPAHGVQVVNFTLMTSQSGGSFDSYIHINQIG